MLKDHVLLLTATCVAALLSRSSSNAQTAPDPRMVPVAPAASAATYPGQRLRPYARLSGAETLNPGAWPQHWPYPDEYNSVAAASAVHHLRYTDEHINFVEVAYFAGVHGQLHGHPWASVFAVDAPTPKSVNERLDPDRAPKLNQTVGPGGAEWPFCRTMGPESPHAETNLDTWPHHFYRMEFKRLDGADIQKNWKTWYPRALDPPYITKPIKVAASAPKLTSDWPYPAVYDSYRAAPNNYRLLYEDDKMRLIEVMLRPGETSPVHGNPYPSVLAMDGVSGAAPVVHDIDAKSPLNGQGDQMAGPPPEFTAPSCAATAPRALHTLSNPGTAPIHYYRIEFKRIDGATLKENWRQWYPWMSTLADEYAKNPYRPNY